MDIKFQNYGQERERIATESELEIYNILKTFPGCSQIELIRKSNNYVSAVLDDWDLARFKYTPNAKWINFPVLEKSSDKHYIESPSEVSAFGDLINKSIEHIEKYQ